MSRQSRSVAVSGAAGWLGGETPADKACRVLAVLTGFSIPLSTSFSEITTGLFMACWVLSGDLMAKLAVIRRNGVALLSLALFGLLALGMTWSSESWIEAGRCLLKYRELLYLPMFVVVFREPRLRQFAIWAYMAATVLLLGLSYFERFSGADFGIASTSVDYVIAKDRITHSLMMAYLAYLAAVQFAGSFGSLPSPPAPVPGGEGGIQVVWRWTCAAIVPLAIYNVLFMVQGRTGYLILGALGTLFLFERLGRRGLAVACVVIALAGCGAFQFSTMIRGRIEQTISQLQNQFGPERKHSPDPRMEFYVNTIKLIRRHPFLGTGTGSFRSEYAQLVAGTDDVPTSDPHNEFLHLWSQVGIAGAVLFVVLLATEWLAARRLSGLECHVGRGIVVTIALGSLFNSLILSVTGGLIFSYFGGLAFAALSQGRAIEATVAAGTTADAPSLPHERRAA